MVTLAITAGYVAGSRLEQTRLRGVAAAADAPPQPTRVIELKPGVNWHEATGGR
jgi:hypothetical protein